MAVLGRSPTSQDRSMLARATKIKARQQTWRLTQIKKDEIFIARRLDQLSYDAADFLIISPVLSREWGNGSL